MYPRSYWNSWCHPGWPQTCGYTPASVSQGLGLQACTTIHPRYFTISYSSATLVRLNIVQQILQPPQPLTNSECGYFRSSRQLMERTIECVKVVFLLIPLSQLSQANQTTCRSLNFLRCLGSRVLCHSFLDVRCLFDGSSTLHLLLGQPRAGDVAQ